MASMIKTAAVTLAMNKCPFLSSEVLQIAAKSSAALYSMQARKCPVMGQLLTKVTIKYTAAEQPPPL